MEWQDWSCCNKYCICWWSVITMNQFISKKNTHKLPSLFCLINKQLDKWEYTELVIIYQNITNWNIYIYILSIYYSLYNCNEQPWPCHFQLNYWPSNRPEVISFLILCVSQKWLYLWDLSQMSLEVGWCVIWKDDTISLTLNRDQNCIFC